jgi:hypothetical protein
MVITISKILFIIAILSVGYLIGYACGHDAGMDVGFKYGYNQAVEDAKRYIEEGRKHDNKK